MGEGQLAGMMRDCSPQSILAVVCPPPQERVRPSQQPDYNPALPSIEGWRMMGCGQVGVPLAPQGSHIVRCNFFQVNAANLPEKIFHYHVSMKRIDRDGNVDGQDCVADEDLENCVKMMTLLRQEHAEWGNCGFVYDGRSSVFTHKQIEMASTNENGQGFMTQELTLSDSASAKGGKRFQVTLSLIETVFRPQSGAPKPNYMRAIDTSLLSFARWDVVKPNPDWFLVGSKIYRSSGTQFSLANGYVAMHGFFAGLKTCVSGMYLVADMSTSCFLKGGKMLELMCLVGDFVSIDVMVSEARRGPFPPPVLDRISEFVKGAKCRLYHLDQKKRIKGLGPASNSRESMFEIEGGKHITVEEYYTMLANDPTKPAYRRALPDGRLKYPWLPTVLFGTSNHRVLIPAELVWIPGGQTRNKKITRELTAQLIRHAAVRPDERFKLLTNSDVRSGECSIVTTLRNTDSDGFGLSEINPVPMAVKATILPQAKLLYGDNRQVDPMLAGEWKMDRNSFLVSPPNAEPRGFMYGVVLVADREPSNCDDNIRRFQEDMEREGASTGLRLFAGGPTIKSSENGEELRYKLQFLHEHGAKIVFVMMTTSSYGLVKWAGDLLGIQTQCLRWRNIEKPPRGYHGNVLLKVNTKLGGVNHSLISRLPNGQPPQGKTFQSPPASLS